LKNMQFAAKVRRWCS